MKRQVSNIHRAIYGLLTCLIFYAVASPTCAETVQWGPYSVVSKQTSSSGDTDRRWKIQIVSSSGTTLREIHGFNFAHIKELSFGSKCNPVLLFELGDGGNDGLNLVYAYSFSTSTGIKNLLATDGDLNDFEFRSLHYHLLPELIIHDMEALTQFDHFSRFGLGDVLRVYGWDGDSYQEKTPLYSEVFTSNLSNLRNKFLRSLPSAERYVRGPFVDGQGDSYSSSHEDVMAATINYWANAIVAGKSSEADELFQQKASPGLQRWLKSKRALLLQTLSYGHQNIKTDESKLVGT